jgi:hypothetical protein
VNEDQHLAIEGAPEARPLDLARLVDRVAVGQQDDPAPPPDVTDRLQRAGIKPLGEGIVD